MPAGPESGAAARNIIGRAEGIIARWPGGSGRSLWQRLTIIQDEPADLALGLWFACAGAQVQVCCPDERPWVRPRDDALMPALRNVIVRREPRLLTHPLDGLQHDNYHRRWGFAYLHGTDEDLSDQIEGPVEIVIFDGLARLGRDPEAMLRLIHGRTQWSSSIEIVPRESDADVEAALRRIEQAAVAVGFGVRPLDNSAASAALTGLSLVRLSAPMSDHPVLDDATIMAHCRARLDIAAALAKGRRVLDAGGWAGLGAEEYLKAGAKHVVNLDVSPEAIRLGRERLGDDERAEFVQWDLNETPLPFDDDAFDLIVCLEALEHLSGQREAIEEFDRLLSPGGLLLISVPDRDFETSWDRINQHRNAFHLHIPSREELGQWLGGFDSIRWLRQADVTGSLVFEEEASSAPGGGRFEVQRPWSVEAAGPQVIMAVCAKAGARGKGRSRARKTAALLSTLRLHANQSDRILELRRDETALQRRVREERFEWWSRANALEGQLHEVNAGLEAAKRETEQWRGRVKTDEHVAALQQRFDQTQATVEAIAAELAAARAQREREAANWLKEINHHANVFNEAQRQRSETAGELRAAQQALAERQSGEQRLAERLEHLTRDLEAARGQAARQEAALREAAARFESLRVQDAEGRAALAAAEARAAGLSAENERLRLRLETTAAEHLAEREAEQRRREQMHTELTAQVSRLSARLDDDRRQLLRRIESLLEQSLEQVDRRCLTVEGKVYDLEDGLDRPAVSPHRNGSPAS